MGNKQEEKGKLVSPKKKKSTAKHHRAPTDAAGRASAGTALEEACTKILHGLVELNVFSSTPRDKQAVAIAAGYKCTTTKTFRTAITKLRNDMDIECLPKQMILLTEQGRSKVGTASITPKTNAEMHAHIVKVVKVSGYKAGCGKMIESLKDGTAKSKMAVANDMGFSRTDSHGFRNCLKALKDHGLIEMVKADGGKQSLIQLSDFAFPEGRP